MTSFFTTEAASKAEPLPESAKFQLSMATLKEGPITAVLVSNLCHGYMYFTRPPGSPKDIAVLSQTRLKQDELYQPRKGMYGPETQRGVTIGLFYNLDEDRVFLLEISKASMISKLLKSDPTIGSVYTFSVSGEGVDIEYSLTKYAATAKISKFDHNQVAQACALLGQVDLNQYFHYSGPTENMPDGEPNKRWGVQKLPQGFIPEWITGTKNSKTLVHEEYALVGGIDKDDADF